MKKTCENSALKFSQHEKSPVTKLLRFQMLKVKGSHSDDTEDESYSATLWQLDKA